MISVVPIIGLATSAAAASAAQAVPRRPASVCPIQPAAATTTGRRHQAHQPGRLEAAEVVGQLVEEEQQRWPVDEQRAVEVGPALVPVLGDDQQPGLVRERQPVQERQPQQQREPDGQGDDARGRADAGRNRPSTPRASPRTSRMPRRYAACLCSAGELVRVPRRRRTTAGGGGLPGRRRHGDDRLPRRRAREAAARRGSRRRREDRAGQGGRARDGGRPGAAAVLRGPRRGAGAVRVELQEAAAPDPGGPGLGRGLLGGDPRRHLHRGVPPHPAAADRHPARRAHGAAGRRGRQGRRRGGGPAAGGAVGLPGDDPRARHGRGRAPAVRGADLERDPRAAPRP